MGRQSLERDMPNGLASSDSRKTLKALVLIASAEQTEISGVGMQMYLTGEVPVRGLGLLCPRPIKRA